MAIFWPAFGKKANVGNNAFHRRRNGVGFDFYVIVVSTSRKYS